MEDNHFNYASFVTIKDDSKSNPIFNHRVSSLYLIAKAEIRNDLLISWLLPLSTCEDIFSRFMKYSFDNPYRVFSIQNKDLIHATYTDIKKAASIVDNYCYENKKLFFDSFPKKIRDMNKELDTPHSLPSASFAKRKMLSNFCKTVESGTVPTFNSGDAVYDLHVKLFNQPARTVIAQSRDMSMVVTVGLQGDKKIHSPYDLIHVSTFYPL